MVVLAPWAAEVAGPAAAGQGKGARIEVVKGFLLNGVRGERGDSAVDERHQFPILMSSSPAPTQPAGNEFAPPLTGQAADSPLGRFLEQSWPNEWAWKWLIATTHITTPLMPTGNAWRLLSCEVLYYNFLRLTTRVQCR